MSEIKVTVNLDEEVKAILASVLSLQTELLSRMPRESASTGSQNLTNFPSFTHPVDATIPATAEDVQKPTEEPKPAKVYQFAEVQAAVMQACQNGKKDAAKALLNQYAKKVSDIPSEKYPEFMAKLEAL